MNDFTKGCLVVGLILAVGFLSVIGYTVSILNKEAILRSSIEAHQRNVETSIDTARKIILQKTQLPRAAKEDLLKLLPAVVEGRAGGSIFKSVQENYPQFTLQLYEDIARTIEAERHTFKNEQEALFDVKREDDALFNRPISGFVLNMFGRKKVDIKVISSSESKDIIETGEENDVDLHLDNN
jgi:hypothetical protein